MVSISAVYHTSQVASRWLSGLQKKSQDRIPNWYHLQKKPKKSPQNNAVQGSCLRLFSLPVKDLKGWISLEYKRRQQRNLRQQLTESAPEKDVCWVRKHMHTAGTQRKRPRQPARQPGLPGFCIIHWLPSDAGNFYSEPFNLEFAVAFRSWVPVVLMLVLLWSGEHTSCTVRLWWCWWAGGSFLRSKLLVWELWSSFINSC